MSTQVRAAIYGRVSTKEQDVEMQLADLRRFVEARGWMIAGEYVDQGYSGSKDRRPALDRLMADARKRKIDAVLCWRFDRMARSTRHLVGMLEEFRALGVDFVSHQEAVETSTPAGKVLFVVISAFAEFERSILIERVNAGIARAKANGVRFGRPRIDRIPLDRIVAEFDRLRNTKQVALLLNTSPSTIQRRLREAQMAAL
jgi:DNA invertase Pin-like site-specific DNA recombinase